MTSVHNNSVTKDGHVQQWNSAESTCNSTENEEREREKKKSRKNRKKTKKTEPDMS